MTTSAPARGIPALHNLPSEVVVGLRHDELMTRWLRHEAACHGSHHPVHHVGRCILAASSGSQSVVRVLAVLHFVRHSLLVPLLGVYLLFVAAVLGGLP